MLIEDVKLCPKCKNALVYDAQLDNYFCPDCSEYYPADVFRKLDDKFGGLCIEMECKMCGRKAILNKNLPNDICLFCYNNLFDIENGVYNFAPDSLIRFKETKESVLKNFLQKCKSANVPDSISGNLNFETVKGMYLPFYLYTIENEANCFMQTKESDNKSYADYFYQKISYIDQEEVLVDISGYLLKPDVAKDFADYNLKSIEKFSADKLEDYITLRNSINDSEAWSLLQKAVRANCELEVAKYKDKYEEISGIDVFNKLKLISKRIVLLPVWVFEFTVDDEMHHLYVNGQTGTMGSDYLFKPSVSKGGSTSFKQKRGLFSSSKPKEESYQVRVVSKGQARRIDFKSKIDFLNEINKYQVNKNDRSAAIRRIR